MKVPCTKYERLTMYTYEMGAFSASDVGRLYQLIKFNDEEFNDAIATAQKDGGALGRALLH